MCGIAGILNITGQLVDRSCLENMTRLMSHRGPDDEGYFVDGRVGLGHRRLSIIDLSDAGHQPMSNEDGSVWVTFNGEIYNYQELIPELESHGHRFRSHCDTEVIVHGFEQWGRDCVKRFNGIWGFAVWDRRKELMFCSRDHMGVKPFYYFWNGKVFLFASEIKALLSHPSVEVKPNWPAVHQYYVEARLDTGNETLYRDIQQLEPAGTLFIEGQRLEPGVFWRWPENPETHSQSDATYADRFRELFFDAVRLQMRSDAPIGTCLSGGLDSSSIACSAARMDPNVRDRYRAFVAFTNDPNFDERPYAAEVVNAAHIQPEWIPADGREFVEEIPRMVWHHDEPVLSSSMYMQWHVMRRAHECGFKVLLDGQGADELLAGYISFYFLALNDYIRNLRLLKAARTVISLATSRTPFVSSTLAQAVGKYTPQFTAETLRRWSPLRAAFGWRGVAEGNLSSDLRPSRPGALRHFPGASALRRGALNSLIYPLRAILHMEDRSSMAFSIESRVPFLDYRLVELINALPDDQKFRDGTTKVVLRNALKGVLPEKIRLRRSKLGFNSAVDMWFRMEARESAREILYSPDFERSGIFEARNCRKVFEDHVACRLNAGELLWRTLCLYEWNSRLTKRKMSPNFDAEANAKP